MPAMVDTSMPILLARLETVLHEQAPGVLSSLQPGLTDQEISALETRGDFKLTEDLRAFYHWRNGSPSFPRRDFIPIHRFVPLGDAVAQRATMRQQTGESFMQRVAFTTLAGHRAGWLMVFEDGCGDGYFYDPDRRTTGGSFFYSFAEDGSYLFFPSVRNFVAGMVECFETGAYRVKPDGSLTEDFAASLTIWCKYGAAPPR